MPTSAEMATIPSVDAWLEIITRVRESVVHVTAAENYRLISWERKGHIGPEKYSLARDRLRRPRALGRLSAKRSRRCLWLKHRRRRRLHTKGSDPRRIVRSGDAALHAASDLE